MMRKVVKRGGWSVIIALVCASGCATTDRNRLEASLAAYKPHTDFTPPDADYVLACPDHLTVRVAARDDIGFAGVVDPEGRIELPSVGRLRVEGLTQDAVRSHISRVAGVPVDSVSVVVTKFRSRYVFLTGSVNESQQAVPYQGPETVVDFLRRGGGLKPGAALNQIHVVRSHVAQGVAPHIFHVDVEAILLNGDNRSNIVIQPYDQVYVGETRRSAVVTLLPPWLRPAFKTACLLCPNPNALRLRP